MFYCIIDSNFGRIFKYQISYVFGEKNSEFLKFIEISSQKVPKMIGIRPPWEVTPLWLSWTYLDTYQGFNKGGGGGLAKRWGVTLRSKKTKILGKKSPKKPIFGAEGGENFLNMKNFAEFQEFQGKFEFIEE